MKMNTENENENEHLHANAIETQQYVVYSRVVRHIRPILQNRLGKFQKPVLGKINKNQK